jgi:hypothetical protein
LPLDFSGTAPEVPVEGRTPLTGTDDDMAETVRAYRSAGLDEIIVGVSTADLDCNTDAMSHFMERGDESVGPPSAQGYPSSRPLPPNAVHSSSILNSPSRVWPPISRKRCMFLRASSVRSNCSNR